MLEGRWITLAPLDAEKHAEALYAGSNGEAGRDSVWTYLPYGPSRIPATSRRHRAQGALSRPAILRRHRQRLRPRGWLPKSDADRPGKPRHRGRPRHVHAGNAADRRATEAQYLFARYVFDVLGNRRYEWKCDNLNAPSKRAAGRFGLTFEGVFRQHMIVKGRNRDTAWFAMLDGEWPARKAAYERWLSPDNFDADGRQRQRLSELMPKTPAGDHGGDADVLAPRRNADR